MPNAVGTQQAGIGRYQYALHAQHGRDVAGMQAAGAAKGQQGIIGGLIAPRNGDAADGFRHFFIGNLFKPLQQRQLSRPLTSLLQKLLLQSVQCLCSCFIRNGDAHEPGIELTQQQVDIGEGEGAACTITGGARLCSCTFGPYAQLAVVDSADRTATGCYGLYIERRRLQLNAVDLSLESVVKVLVEARRIGTGPAHIKGDDGLQAADGSHPGGTGGSAGRAAEEAVPGLKTAVRTQRSSTAHDQKISFGEGGEMPGNAVEVGVYDGCQIGVDKGRLHAVQQLDGRRKAAAERQIGLTRSAQGSAQLLLMRRIPVGVEKGDGYSRLITGGYTAVNFFAA